MGGGARCQLPSKEARSQRLSRRPLRSFGFYLRQLPPAWGFTMGSRAELRILKRTPDGWKVDWKSIAIAGATILGSGAIGYCIPLFAGSSKTMSKSAVEPITPSSSRDTRSRIASSGFSSSTRNCHVPDASAESKSLPSLRLKDAEVDLEGTRIIFEAARRAELVRRFLGDDFKYRIPPFAPPSEQIPVGQERQ